MEYPDFDLAVREKFVRPFYLKLLHANFAHGREGGGEFNHQLAHAASAISDDQIVRLLEEKEWRGRLCAAWFIGLSGRAPFVTSIGEKLLASEMVYAGQGYCVALGLIGGKQSSDALHAYLRRYLPLEGRFYDQDWAVGALANIEGSVPAEFLDPQLWRDPKGIMDPTEGADAFSAVVAHLDRFGLLPTHTRR
jgi:Family of unknown function (DUF6000)